jgi:hypothetical protein
MNNLTALCEINNHNLNAWVFLYAVELCADRGRIMTDNGLWLTLKVFPGAKKGKIFADSVDLISTTY